MAAEPVLPVADVVLVHCFEVQLLVQRPFRLRRVLDLLGLHLLQQVEAIESLDVGHQLGGEPAMDGSALLGVGVMGCQLLVSVLVVADQFLDVDVALYLPTSCLRASTSHQKLPGQLSPVLSCLGGLPVFVAVLRVTLWSFFGHVALLFVFLHLLLDLVDGVLGGETESLLILCLVNHGARNASRNLLLVSGLLWAALGKYRQLLLVYLVWLNDVHDWVVQ